MKFPSLAGAAVLLVSSVLGAETPEQVPNWSSDDLDFFFHGSMSAEGGHNYGTALPVPARRDLIEFLKTL